LPEAALDPLGRGYLQLALGARAQGAAHLVAGGQAALVEGEAARALEGLSAAPRDHGGLALLVASAARRLGRDGRAEAAFAAVTPAARTRALGAVLARLGGDSARAKARALEASPEAPEAGLVLARLAYDAGALEEASAQLAALP